MIFNYQYHWCYKRRVTSRDLSKRYRKDSLYEKLKAHNKGGTTRKEMKNTLDRFTLEDLDHMLSNSTFIEAKNGVIKGKIEKSHTHVCKLFF